MKWTLLIAAALWAPTAWAQEHPVEFGGVLGPAMLPAGGVSAYGFAGAPELGAGYRQGLGPVEAEGRVRFDYIDVTVAVEGLLRSKVWQARSFALAPSVGVGLSADSGARYIDLNNFSYLAFRVDPGLLASLRIRETLQFLSEVEVPIDLTFSPGGGTRVKGLLSAGVEFFVGNGVSVLALAGLGMEGSKEPEGVPVYRLAYDVRIGFGWRLF